MEKAIGRMLAKHRANDQTHTDREIVAKEENYVKTLRKRAKKNRDWRCFLPCTMTAQ
jgi:hypothetical protein